MIGSGRRYILSISGGNILTSFGGTEKVIVTHQRLFNDSGISYIYIYPVSKVFVKARLFYYWGVIVDGVFYGLLTIKQIIEKLIYICLKDGRLLKIHLHHLKNIDLIQIRELLDAIESIEIFVYLHDYYLICERYNLLNDDLKYCGNGVPSKEKCMGCKGLAYEHKAKERKELINKYIDRVRFIAPSDSAAQIVGGSISSWKNKIDIIYHQKLIGEYEGNTSCLEMKSQIKIAFCGLQLSIKGWPQYVNAVKKAQQDNMDHIFYHLGIEKKHVVGITNVPVGFQNNMFTMIEALRNNKIDCVILWSICPETYSYVYYECMSANTFIITNVNSGNIADRVREFGNGIVLNSDNELVKLICNKKRLVELINKMKHSDFRGPEYMKENDKIIQYSLERQSKELVSREMYISEKVNRKQRAVEFLYRKHFHI